MSSLRNVLTGAVAGFALVSATTANAASVTSAPTSAPTTAAAASSVAGQTQNPWLTLSIMDPTAAVALGGAAAAAQPDAPPPPPPQYNGGFTTPPIPVLIIWAAWLALFIWIVSHKGHGHFTPVSPG